jgi:hypothetical protein
MSSAVTMTPALSIMARAVARSASQAALNASHITASSQKQVLAGQMGRLQCNWTSPCWEAARTPIASIVWFGIPVLLSHGLHGRRELG